MKTRQAARDAGFPLVALVTVSNEEAALTRVLGLTVLERNIRSLNALGFSVFVLVPAGEGLAALCERCQVGLVEARRDFKRPYLKIAGDFQYALSFFDRLKRLLREHLLSGFEIRSGSFVPVTWFGATRQDPVTLSLAPGDVFCVQSLLETRGKGWAVKSLSNAFFVEIYRQSRGWIARAINKRVSFFLTRLFVKLPISPNGITLVTFLVGLGGCLLFLSSSYGMRALGAVLLQASSILDGCDGEVARLTVRSSRVGAWLDTIADDVINHVMFACLYVGYFFQFPSVALLKFCMLGSIACLGISFFLYQYLITHNTPHMADFRFSWVRERFDAPADAQKSFFGRYVNPVLKHDFVLFFVALMVLMDLRPVLVILIVAVWVGFFLYLASFLYGVLRKPVLEGGVR